MKKIFLLVLFTLNFTYSQDCKFRKNEIDDFTKKKVLVLKETILGSAGLSENYVSAELNSNSNIYINFNVRFTGHHAIVVKESNKILLLLNNEEIIEAPVGEILTGKLTGDGGLMSYTDFTIKFNTTEETLIKLSTLGIKKIRVETTDGYKDFEVKEKRNIQFKNAVNCFLNEYKK